MTDSAYSLGLEFNFPILNIYQGLEFLPFLFRRIHGTLVADYGAFKGILFENYFSPHVFTDLSRSFMGGGVELHADMTISHFVPLRISLGAYYPIKQMDTANDLRIYINFFTPVPL